MTSVNQPPSLAVCEITAPGRGAVSTMSVQGDLSAIDRSPPLFRAANGRALTEQPLDRVCFGRWGDEIVEDVVLCRTAPDMVEIHCHGGRAAVSRILADLQARGALVETSAQQLGRRMPVVQVECTLALTRATTERTASHLAEQASGVLQHAIEAIVALFEDADGPVPDATPLASIAARLDQLLARESFGRHLTQPWSVVLCGRPNVGKSSLINALAGFSRAIVSPVPGTTRDVVTVDVALDGWPVELADTAGIRNSADEIEARGIDRAAAQLAAADLKLLLLDVSEPLGDDDFQLLRSHPDAIVVAHKCDLDPCWACDDGRLAQRALPVSSVSQQGLSELIRAITARLVSEVPAPGAPVPVSPRIINVLRQARASLSDEPEAARRLLIALLTNVPNV